MQLEPKRMSHGFDDASAFNTGSEKSFVIRDADEAFYANNKARCVEAIIRLYDLLDDALVLSRRNRCPPRRVSRS